MKPTFLLPALLSFVGYFAGIEMTQAQDESKPGRPERGIVGQKAPEWEVSHWIQLPEGKKAVQIGDYKDKVLCLYFFQSW